MSDLLTTKEAADLIPRDLAVKANLSYKEVDVVNRRADGESYADIADTYGVKRQRAFQINLTAIRKLKRAGYRLVMSTTLIQFDAAK